MDLDHVHDLKKLVGDMPETHHEWLEGMLLDSQPDELSVFRVKSFYGDGNTLPWPRDSASMLLGAVQSLSGRLAAHALNAMGKTPRDVGHSNWLGDGPLAGWGSLPLDYFSPPAVAERERTAEAVAAMRLFLGNVLSPAVLDRIESAWHRNEPSEDHLQAIHAVLQTPSAWRTLLPDDHKD